MTGCMILAARMVVVLCIVVPVARAIDAWATGRGVWAFLEGRTDEDA